MNERFSRMIRLLFPVSHAFRVFRGTVLRKLIDGLSALAADIRHETELVYLDLFPDTTRAADAWQKQFGIILKNPVELSFVPLLKSLWMGTGGGQSLEFLQSLLKQIDSKINIIENIPIKNPRDSNSVILSVCRYKTMVCGNRQAVCGYRVGDVSFTPGVIINDAESLYDIPNNPLFWSLCFYIGGSVMRNKNNQILFINKIKINKKWRDYIEYLVLKIKPVHTKVIMYVEYIEEEA